MKMSLARIKSRVPDGQMLPSGFDDFLRAKPPFPIEWNSLYHYSFKRSAIKKAVPFLRLFDGGLVALWYHADGPGFTEPAVVHIGGHGELEVLAIDFDNFLKAVNARCTSLGDIDEEEEEERIFRIPGVSGKPKRAGLSALQRKLQEWFKLHTSLLEPHRSRGSESLRRRVHGIAKAMIRDGRSKLYTLSSWWSMDFQIERAGDNLAITYRDYGKWYKVPAKYGLVKEAQALLALVQNKKRRKYELSVTCYGLVSIDKDRQLVLLRPGFKLD